MKTHLRIAHRKAAITRSKRAPNRVVDASARSKQQDSLRLLPEARRQ